MEPPRKVLTVSEAEYIRKVMEDVGAPPHVMRSLNDTIDTYCPELKGTGTLLALPTVKVLGEGFTPGPDRQYTEYLEYLLRMMVEYGILMPEQARLMLAQLATECAIVDGYGDTEYGYYTSREGFLKISRKPRQKREARPVD